MTYDRFVGLIGQNLCEHSTFKTKPFVLKRRCYMGSEQHNGN